MVYGRDSSERREGEKRNVLILLLAQMFLVSGSFSLEGSPDHLQSVPVATLAQVWPLTNGASTAKLGTS
jgi:hypothetical protein